MGEIFLKLLSLSAAASLLILLVLCTRPLLKKAPAVWKLLLWGVVAIRLVLPFTVESNLAFLPSAEQTQLADWGDDYIGAVEIHHDNTPEYEQAVEAGNAPLYATEDGYYVVTQKDSIDPPKTVKDTVLPILSVVWLSGAMGMLIYAGISFLLLKRRVRTAVKLQRNVYQSEHITSPFVLGFFSPRIYLPYGIEKGDKEYVLAHEQAHIYRGDHLFKPLGFLLAALHWFNPLVWVAYILFCKDIELACDERVIKTYSSAQKADYASALLACSMGGQNIGVCPIAFGEVGVKERVKSIVNYKKPTFWIILAAVLLLASASFFFFTRPKEEETTRLMGANYDIEEVLLKEEGVQIPLQYCISADYYLYEKYEQNDLAFELLGKLEPYTLTNEALQVYLKSKKPSVKTITDSYILRLEEDMFYLVFQTENGKTYLAYGWDDVLERGDEYSDDTHLQRLYELKSDFTIGSISVNFFEYSLHRAVGEDIFVFSEQYADPDLYDGAADDAPYCLIVGFATGIKEGATDRYVAESYTDFGVAVFETGEKGYRLLSHLICPNAVDTQNGFYFCENPVVADVNGISKTDNTFDVIFVTNPALTQVKRVYSAKGKEDKVVVREEFGGPNMLLRCKQEGEGYSEVKTYCYDQTGNLLAMHPQAAQNPTLWFDDSDLAEVNLGGRREINLEAFPDTTFVWLAEQVQAVEQDGSILMLYNGSPIYSVYFADLTGDGYPELVSILEDPSADIGHTLQIYDYQNHSGYAYCATDQTYRLSIENGNLMLHTQSLSNYLGKESYKLVYLDETIQMIRVN